MTKLGPGCSRLQGAPPAFANTLRRQEKRFAAAAGVSLRRPIDANNLRAVFNVNTARPITIRRLKLLVPAAPNPR